MLLYQFIMTKWSSSNSLIIFSYFFRNTHANCLRIPWSVMSCYLDVIQQKRSKEWKMHILQQESINMMTIRYNWFIITQLFLPNLFSIFSIFLTNSKLLFSWLKDGINILECRLAKDYIESGVGDEVDSTTAGGCTHMQVRMTN